jgi:hypothetical protein
LGHPFKRVMRIVRIPDARDGGFRDDVTANSDAT